MQAEVVGGDALAGAVMPGKRRGILVHCDMGHNRSPTLTLAFLVSHGLSLREAYRHVLSQRQSIDPLPPYRRGLRAYELAVRAESSVEEEEPFAMHVTQLMDLVSRESGGKDGACEGLEDTNSGLHFGVGLAVRAASIEALLAETAETAETAAAGAEESDSDSDNEEEGRDELQPPPSPASDGLRHESWAEDDFSNPLKDDLSNPLKPWAAAVAGPSTSAEEVRCLKCEAWKWSSKRTRLLMSFTSPRTVLHRCKPSCDEKLDVRGMAARSCLYYEKVDLTRMAARGCLFR